MPLGEDAPTLPDEAPVAQRIEHLTTDQKVWGSNPYGRTFAKSRDILNLCPAAATLAA